MSYKELFRENNEQYTERIALVMERIGDIAVDGAITVPEVYRGYFEQMANYLLLEHSVAEEAISGEFPIMTAAQGEQLNQRLYDDVQEPGYEESYANPAYACSRMGIEYGQILSMLDAKFHSIAPHCAEGNLTYICLYAELFVELYNCFEDIDNLSVKELKSIIYSFMHDYTEVFNQDAIERLVTTRDDYYKELVMHADLSDASYLFRYAMCIGTDEMKSYEFLNTFSDEQMQEMADTFTEGYRIGFATTGKDITKKSIAEIRYPIGFERMVRFAVNNFKKIGLDSILRPFSVSLNKQYTYDHREDRGLWLDKALIERGLEVERSVWEKLKAQAPAYGGPAVIDIFGTKPFSPEQKDACVKFTEKQQKLSVYQRSESSQLINKYIRGEERSFTIIAYPVPSIGEQFEEIFAETVKINTLDYALYRDMQQKIIDVLDQAEKVHITGKNNNKTDLYVSIWPLKDATKESAFENCVADVNIPVGEVFTSPVLKGTTGKLFVSQVYLNELKYLNLEIDFEDGVIKDYTCTNFEKEEECRKYIKENVLMNHETLPMGEFAIGTNTTAYRMARDFDIADKLPILIAEKTGPHFAVGDTCYSHEEDMVTYNPDGKQIVARENDFSKLRSEDMSKAYFNCHTDITIPYDELDKITVIRKDGTTEDIISDGRFVLAGIEELNKPLDR